MKGDFNHQVSGCQPRRRSGHMVGGICPQTKFFARALRTIDLGDRLSSHSSMRLRHKTAHMGIPRNYAR